MRQLVKRNVTSYAVRISLSNNVIEVVLISWPAGDVIPAFVARNARHDCRQDRRFCLDGTRVDVLSDIYQWSSTVLARNHRTGEVNSGSTSSILWLSGFAGTGKTTLANTICEKLESEGDLGASFFCSRYDAECSSAQKIIPTIAYQIAISHPEFEEALLGNLKKDPLVLNADISVQITKLIIDPLSAVRTSFLDCVVAVDALDECTDRSVVGKLLTALITHIDHLSPLHFFITSRPEPHIASHFSNRNISSSAVKTYSLQHLSLDAVRDDIELYLRTALSDIKYNRGYQLPDDWPNEQDISGLALASDSSFIYASTAINFIADPEYSAPVERLHLLTMKRTSSSGPSLNLLAGLYQEILTSAFSCAPDLSLRMEHLLGSILALRETITLVELAALIQLPWYDVHNSLNRLKSILDIPMDTSGGRLSTIQLIHPTLAEYLLSPSVGLPKPITIKLKERYVHLLRCCLEAIGAGQAQAMEQSSLPAAVKQQPERYRQWNHLLLESRRKVADHLQYACRYWLQHLVQVETADHNDPPSADNDREQVWIAIDRFLVEQKFYWSAMCRTMGIAKEIEAYMDDLVGQVFISRQHPASEAEGGTGLQPSWHAEQVDSLRMSKVLLDLRLVLDEEDIPMHTHSVKSDSVTSLANGKEGEDGFGHW